jgi:hypothetical protein
VIDKFVSGWALYYLAYFETGQFFSPMFSGGDPSNTNTFGGLPDRIGNGNLPTGDRTLQRWFDPSAFAVPSAGQFGNSGMNILEGPGYQSHNLSVIKTFKLTERFNLTGQLSISNLFNHPNFIAPNSNISFPATVGQIFSTVGADQQGGGAREMEVKVRLEW